MSRSFFQTHAVPLGDKSSVPLDERDPKDACGTHEVPSFEGPKDWGLVEELFAVLNECVRRAYAHGVNEGLSPEEMTLAWAHASEVFTRKTIDKKTCVVTHLLMLGKKRSLWPQKLKQASIVPAKVTSHTDHKRPQKTLNASCGLPNIGEEIDFKGTSIPTQNVKGVER
jgi:hypothetical protein